MGASTNSQLQYCLDPVVFDRPGTLEKLLEISEASLRRLARHRLRDFPNLTRWVQTDDVLQNAMLRLNRSLKELRPQTVRAYFGLAALQIRRELLDLTKSIFGPIGFGTLHHTDAVGSGVKLVADDGISPKEMVGKIDELTELLSFEERELVDLLFIHSLTQDEAAVVLGISTRTLKRRWLLARMKLGRSAGQDNLTENTGHPPETDDQADTGEMNHQP